MGGYYSTIKTQLEELIYIWKAAARLRFRLERNVKDRRLLLKERHLDRRHAEILSCIIKLLELFEMQETEWLRL